MTPERSIPTGTPGRFSRRALLTSASLALAGGAVASALASGWRPTPPGRDTPLTALSLDLLAAHRGSAFRLIADGRPVARIEMVDVNGLATGAAPGGQHFQVVFRQAAGAPLEQGTYRLEHDRLGAFDLFIVPERPGPDAQRYVATFNWMPA